MPSLIPAHKDVSIKNRRGEKWKDVPGLEGYVCISNHGRIKRLEYETEYRDGRRYVKPEMIIKPAVFQIPNSHVGDRVYFLAVNITLFKQKYHLSVARHVYYCFIKHFDLDDPAIVILPKDGNGLNIKPANLIKASHHDKQQRIFQRSRALSAFNNPAFREKGIVSSGLKRRKQVTQYNLQGKKIRTYASISEAAEATGISISRIGQIANGYEETAGGFIWRFGKAAKADMSQLEQVRRERRQRNKLKFGKKLSQYDLSGKRVATFQTISDAAKATGQHPANITGMLNGSRKSAGGFIWKSGYSKKKE